ncbi:outer membrane protein OmpK [Shewanella algae]|uniref:outer membrane protein OmpK n=1 Tax=Shewanella algae TaxID=38313 RepID=UPI003B67BB3E
MLIRTSLLGLLPLLLLIPTAQAEVFQQQNGIKVGYEHLLDAKDNNPNLYSQSYLSFTNTTRASWGDFAAWLTLENPLDDNDNQQGNKAGATVKSWLKLDYNLGDIPFNLWLQSFTANNKNRTEENFYYGLSYDIQWQKLKGTMAIGAHYAWGDMDASQQDFNSSSGYAAMVQLAYPLTQELLGKFYFETQFDRSDEQVATFLYRDSGYQAILGLDYQFLPQASASLAYKYRDAWGGSIHHGGELLFELGYQF